MPYMEADSLTYLMISGPLTMAFSSVHGRHGKPKSVQVGIRAYAGVVEQLPGAANRVPALLGS
jgi:hypothetical protein